MIDTDLTWSLWGVWDRRIGDFSKVYVRPSVSAASSDH
jgi:hypothetical protein